MYAVGDQSKETARRSIHIIRRIVRSVEGMAKELDVQLGERRPFELAALAARDGAVFGGNVFGVDDPDVPQVALQACPVVL